jgi:predicted lipid-binding transport protein (Tim44 family)
LGGLAAGLGLAWLANSLGLGEGLSQLLMFGLMAFAVMLLWSAFKRSRAAPATAQNTPFTTPGNSPFNVPATVPYRTDSVGNDSSARPYEHSGMSALTGPSGSAGDASSGGAIAAAGTGWSIPQGFDTVGFLTAAKVNFVNLQAAWDRSDIPSLRAMMTDAMLEEIRSQLAEREAHTGAVPNLTEVVMIDARLLGIEELPTDYMASVEFSGMIREDPSAGPSPFREVWNMTKAKNGGGWLVAGVQALQ